MFGGDWPGISKGALLGELVCPVMWTISAFYALRGFLRER